MKKIKELIIKIDNWMLNIGYNMCPHLTKHMNKKND